MTYKKIILDFDGTLTDANAEAETFTPGFLSGVRKELGLNSGEFMNEWLRLNNIILSSPENYGWRIDNKIIAPAYSDPYILCTTIAQEMIKKYNHNDSSFLTKLFKENYVKSKIVFRKDVKEFLTYIDSKYSVNIITNSSTELVQKKMDILGFSGKSIQLIGNAKKYELENSWDVVPESQDLGFGRPIYLRRKKYYDALSSLGHIDAMCVIGDIFEMDLALPKYLGAKTFLISNTNTWKKEQSVAEQGADNLKDLMKYL